MADREPSLADAMQAFTEIAVELRRSIEALNALRGPGYEHPIVAELQRQVADLQAREAAREQFIADLQQQTVSHVVALLPEASARAGPGYVRQQERVARLNEFAMRSSGGTNVPT